MCDNLQICDTWLQMFKPGHDVAFGTKEAPAGRSSFTPSLRHTTGFFPKGNTKGKQAWKSQSSVFPSIFLYRILDIALYHYSNIKYLEEW